jgi:hypothetical protein
MKVAQHLNNLELVIASASAPETAVCPHCGGVVIRRQRKRMNGAGCAYFWRHRDNRNRTCNGRSRPIHTYWTLAFLSQSHKTEP